MVKQESKKRSGYAATLPKMESIEKEEGQESKEGKWTKGVEVQRK